MQTKQNKTKQNNDLFGKLNFDAPTNLQKNVENHKKHFSNQHKNMKT